MDFKRIAKIVLLLSAIALFVGAMVSLCRHHSDIGFALLMASLSIIFFLLSLDEGIGVALLGVLFGVLAFSSINDRQKVYTPSTAISLQSEHSESGPFWLVDSSCSCSPVFEADCHHHHHFSCVKNEQEIGPYDRCEICGRMRCEHYDINDLCTIAERIKKVLRDRAKQEWISSPD